MFKICSKYLKKAALKKPKQQRKGQQDTFSATICFKEQQRQSMVFTFINLFCLLIVQGKETYKMALPFHRSCVPRYS